MAAERESSEQLLYEGFAIAHATLTGDDHDEAIEADDQQMTEAQHFVESLS
jgi:hypothetical protein